jgi:hypothetical protein
VSEQPGSESTSGTSDTDSTDERLHADLPADAASSGDLPSGGEPTPGSDNDGAEAGYTPPSGTDAS